MLKYLQFSYPHCVILVLFETYPTLDRLLLSNALLTSFFSCSDLSISLFCSHFFLRNWGFFSKWVVACANWSLFGAWFFIARSWSTGAFLINFGRKIVDRVVRSDLLFDKMDSLILIVSFECFNSICNISFQRSEINLDLLLGHCVSYTRNNVIMY